MRLTSSTVTAISTVRLGDAHCAILALVVARVTWVKGHLAAPPGEERRTHAGEVSKGVHARSSVQTGVGGRGGALVDLNGAVPSCPARGTVTPEEIRNSILIENIL